MKVAFGIRAIFLYNVNRTKTTAHSHPQIKQYTIRVITPNIALRKHAYSNILKILQPKKENFQRKKSDIFYLSAQNIDCGYSLEPPRRGGSNEYPQSMFFSKIRIIMYTPVNPSFTV